MTAPRILPCAALVIGCFPRVSHAQAAPPSRPAYAAERYDENWSFLRNPARRTDFFDPIKWIPLGHDGLWYVSFGGEVRERFQDTRNQEFGLLPPTRDSHAYHRIFMIGDLHLGPHFRTFVELVNAAKLGQVTNPPPVEQDPLDMLQGFADLVVTDKARGDVTVRGGRQEMSFGSSRLISFRETPNVRRAFDGARAFWTLSGKRVDAFIVRPVNPRLHVFDDIRDSTQLFWGVYATSPLPVVKRMGLDVYYLGLDRKNAAFAQGVAREHRHTIGARLFRDRAGFDWDEARDFHRGVRSDNDLSLDWDVEGAFQFGSFGSADIRAWMISSNWGFALADVRSSPRLGLKADAMSGDGNLQDNRLGTFNPFYPALQYYSQPGTFAPANLLNLQPNLTLDFSRELSANVAWGSLWRETKSDAFYQPALTAIPGTATGGRHIGYEASANVAWQANAHLTVTGTYAHFAPGGSVKNVGGQSGDFLLAVAQFRF